MNSSVHKLAECIKFSDEEFSQVCNDFKQMDDKSILDTACWKQELDYLLWERDKE
jgi:hypothetical protein